MVRNSLNCFAVAREKSKMVGTCCMAVTYLGMGTGSRKSMRTKKGVVM